MQWSRLTCLLLLLVAGCGRSPVAPAGTRTLAAFEPYLTASLTPASATAQFGQPDEITGSGLRILVYRLTDGRKILLGFPGEAPIIYARLQNTDGTVTDLPVRP